jgi:hypothetical protein
MFADVVNRANVRMIQCGRGPCFALESFDGAPIATDIFGQKFQRNPASEPHIFSSIDDTHAACTNFGLDLVMIQECSRREVHRGAYHTIGYVLDSLSVMTRAIPEIRCDEVRSTIRISMRRTG